MKKKPLKKLVLNRETLAELDHSEIWQVAGGATGAIACPYSGYRTCTTCQMTCTTNYC